MSSQLAALEILVWLELRDMLRSSASSGGGSVPCRAAAAGSSLEADVGLVGLIGGGDVKDGVDRRFTALWR